jgi:DNA-binding NtrC family response regulator
MVQKMAAYGPNWPVVLVVDDEAAIRAFLCEYLHENGFYTVAVGSADSAIHLLDLGLAIDLVFSDVRMPGKRDGYGLALWIAEHRPDLPVILTTGDLGKENAAVRLSHAEVMAKPYELEIAVEKIRQSIERRNPAPH